MPADLDPVWLSRCMRESALDGSCGEVVCVDGDPTDADVLRAAVGG